jgi:hypothetical protein
MKRITMSRFSALAACALALAGVSLAAGLIAGLGACSGAERHPVPQKVPLTWRDVRDSAGHTAHVVQRGVPCRDCHGDDGFQPPPLEVCSKCHAAVHASLHPADPLDKVQTPGCQDCHGFGAQLDVTPTHCMRCHTEPQGRHAAVGAHSKQSCLDCHRAHGAPTLDPRPCQSCHASVDSPRDATRGGVNVAASPRQRGREGPLSIDDNHHAGARSCLDCHRMHETDAVADQGCATCHARQNGKIKVDDRALTVGHATCTGCHAPHQFDKAQTVACTACHTRQHTFVPEKHAGCTSCHAQHKGSEPRPCTSCHAKSVSHPPDARRGPAAACAGCHPPHTLAAGQLAVACATCHDKPHHATAQCLDCHAPHAARPRLEPALCAKCHARESGSSAGSGHATCTQCHASAAHEPGKPPPACASCHAPKASQVRKGHDTCASCHTAGPHQPKTSPAACATCHAAEARTAPTGHAQCASCHEPHSGARRPDRTCQSCHANKAGQGHGKRVDCATCHRPHGPAGTPAPPPCASCHPAEQRTGLHRVAQHGTCNDCHGAHEPRPADDRATCLRCHTAQVNHEPRAVRCGSCHPFSSGAHVGAAPVRPPSAPPGPRSGGDAAVPRGHDE